MKKTGFFPRTAVVMMFGVLVLAGCKPDNAGGPPAPGGEGAGMPPPPAVTVAVPLSKDVQEWDDFTGRFEAVERVEIRARVSGYLQEIHFKDGDLVNKGDLLFTIDQRPFEATLKEAEAALNSAKSRLDLAAKELNRASQLSKQGFATKQTLDQRTEEKQSAAEAVDAAQARLEQAKLDIEYSRIAAPISGRISRALIDVGNLVDGGMQTATMLTTIVSLDPIHFYFDVDEQTYLKYARMASAGERPSSRATANPVYVALADSDKYDYAGKMDFVDNAIDPATGTMRGRAIFDNPDYTIIPGMFGRARIMGSGSYKALLIPDEAVGVDQSRNFVFTVTPENMVASKTVTLGPKVEGLRAVKSGLDGTEKIIIAGLQMLRDGMPVTPELKTIQSVPDVLPVGAHPANEPDPASAPVNPQTMQPSEPPPATSSATSIATPPDSGAAP